MLNQDAERENRRSKIILGIDDSRSMQVLLQGIICSAGFSYVGVSNGNDAMAEIAARNPFDVILLDVELPGIKGFDLCKRIRKHPKGKNVPIVFLTIHNTETDVEISKSVGANTFIIKPFTGKTLLQHLDYWSSRPAELPPER